VYIFATKCREEAGRRSPRQTFFLARTPHVPPGKTHERATRWKPKLGDVIIFNWASWAELLWLAFRSVRPFARSPVRPFILRPSGHPHSPGPASTPSSSSPSLRTSPHYRQQRPADPRARARQRLRPRPQRSRSRPRRWRASTPSRCSTSSRARGTPPRRTPSHAPSMPSAQGVFGAGEAATGTSRARAGGENVRVPVRGYDVWVMCVRCVPPLHPLLSQESGS
jgi:hypothetical protein